MVGRVSILFSMFFFSCLKGDLDTLFLYYDLTMTTTWSALAVVYLRPPIAHAAHCYVVLSISFTNKETIFIL